MKKFSILLIFLGLCRFISAQEKLSKHTAGANEKTPSRSEYFSWINNTNEGATEQHTLINLDFFKWLKNEYGMNLTIYAFDAGAIDGAGFYGSMNSQRFKKQFPANFDNVFVSAKTNGTRLGIWGGPDGFGNSAEEEKSRTDMMIRLCRDYNFMLFKMDAVCGQLRPEKYNAFNYMMNQCRTFSPDLILLNHRLNLGQGTMHSTTYLMGGDETYIDVHMTNTICAPHHRARAIARELPQGLTRLTEDHGVCLSSCLDYWDDDLILQAFQRNLIVSPEIYGNPWLLSDAEFPKLARIFNLHEKYNSIMVNGMMLPETEFPEGAVSRGNENTRLVSLRNISWLPVKKPIKLDQSIGLSKKAKILVKQYHPFEKIIGEFEYGAIVEIEVLPFRSCLIKATSSTDDEIGITGCNYEIVRDVPGKSLIINLLTVPGETSDIKLTGDWSKFKTAKIDNINKNELLKNKSLTIKSGGNLLKQNYHRLLEKMEPCKVPDDAANIYDATCFAADNNALEVRSLKRSGSTSSPAVEAARKAFFEQTTFVERELWDKYLFDNNFNTSFSINLRWNPPVLGQTVLRLDMDKPLHLDKLQITLPDINALQPLKSEENPGALVSKDLKTWEKIDFLAGKNIELDLSKTDSVRYVKISPCPLRISEISGISNNQEVDKQHWRASNLFKNFNPTHWQENMRYFARKAWHSSFTLDEISEGSYLCIAINGVHGTEGAVAGLKINGEYMGCPDRSPSFQSNSWEVAPKETDKNYTYYFPLTKNMTGKKIEAFVLSFFEDKSNLMPEIWITAYPIPYYKKILVLE